MATRSIQTYWRQQQTDFGSYFSWILFHTPEENQTEDILFHPGYLEQHQSGTLSWGCLSLPRQNYSKWQEKGWLPRNKNVRCTARCGHTAHDCSAAAAVFSWALPWRNMLIYFWEVTQKPSQKTSKIKNLSTIKRYRSISLNCFLFKSITMVS